jgi:hypothetical protein
VKGNAVIAQVGGRLVLVPFKLQRIVLRITSSD